MVIVLFSFRFLLNHFKDLIILLIVDYNIRITKKFFSISINKIVLKDCYFNLRNKVVFSNLNLILKQSNIIIGPSGIGKTTLLSLLIQKYVPFKGKILINNEIGLDNISYEFWQKNVFIYIQILLFITVQF